MHNYSGANSVRQKMYNWATLNQKVFRRLGFPVNKEEVDAIVGCKPGAVELLLMRLQKHIAEMRRTSTSPSQATPGMGDASAMPGLIMDGSAAAGSGGGHSQGQVPHFSGFGSSASVASGSSGPAGNYRAPAAAQQQQAVFGGAHANAASSSSVEAVDAAILAEKDTTIGELRETIEILELKIKKLEQVSSENGRKRRYLWGRGGRGERELCITAKILILPLSIFATT